MKTRGLFATAAAALVLAGCPQPDDQRTETITDRDVLTARAELHPAAAAALDSGNISYRERDYERALRHYHEAVEIHGDLAAAWFGIYMAQMALDNPEAAEAAMEQARMHAPDASLIQPDPDMPVPPDHPALPDTLP